jgi:N-acetylmuramoyl-L-alanine amidase
MICAPSPNCDDRPIDTPIDMLVLHYTGMPSGAAALERLRDPAAQVSAHYLIEEDGTVFALVDEQRRAWHAGVSSWRGHSNINARSIGIELVNPGHEFGYRPFPPEQMAALAELALGILSRHPIPARNVVGHADVAPLRKEDPGELFNWAELAKQGIGLWPQGPAAPSPHPLPALLARWGYDTATPAAARAAIVAFQRHYRPCRHDGIEDPETAGLLAVLLNLVGEPF